VNDEFMNHVEHIARYEHVFPSYAQRGISVFAFDQRGFGRTALDPGPDGKRKKEREARKEGYGRTSSEQQKEDIDWAVRHVGETLAGWKDGQGLPVFLMGHSMVSDSLSTFGIPPSFISNHRAAASFSRSALLHLPPSYTDSQVS